ncbi:hypothetical protein Daus18300_004210 [Diaporthe australafricana]|uniref:Uncharacterized protein n=1 Tax=Diaporthe australafricana TaxID=127596 RepID=A0ABR3X9Q3_9PEZI
MAPVPILDEKPSFQPIKDDGTSAPEVDEEILDLFETAMASLHPRNVEEKARSVAAHLRVLLPPSIEKKEYFLFNFWEILIAIARHVPSRHDGQALLVEVLKELNSPAMADGGSNPWKGLPDFSTSMRDNWIDPTFEAGDKEDQEYNYNEWLNLNSFNARLLGSGLVGWVSFAIWELRQGLEVEARPGEIADCRAAVASEWLIYAEPELLIRSSLALDLDEAERRSQRTGELFAGKPGLSLERWDFWKRRCVEIQKTVGETVVARLKQAFKTMVEAERDSMDR